MEMEFKYYLLVLLFISFCTGCCKDDDGNFDPSDICNMNVSGVDFYLDSESKLYLHNYLNSDSIYFLNQNNDTVLVEVVNRVDSLLPYLEFVPCVVDSTMNQFREGFIQQMYVTLYSEDLDIYIYYRLLNSSLTELVVSDKLWVAKGRTLDYNLPDIVDNNGFLSEFSTYNPNGNPENLFVLKNDSMTIGNKVFYNVMEPNPLNTGLPNNSFPNPIIRYTKKEGIVSIEDNVKGINLVYCGSN